jgi:hypothetical protein
MPASAGPAFLAPGTVMEDEEETLAARMAQTFSGELEMGKQPA